MSTSVALEGSRVQAAGTEINLNTNHKQRIYILPTAQGLLYGVMLIVMLLGAINYNNSMAFMLCFLLASLGIVCMLHTYRNLSGLIVTSHTAEPVFAGQSASFPLLINNPVTRERYAISIVQISEKRRLLRSTENSNHIMFSAVSNTHTSVNFPITTTKRGRIKLGKLKIETRFPLGIFTAWSYLDTRETGLVYPSPKGSLTLPRTMLTGNEDNQGQLSGADDFSGFRKYRPGDAVNSIAWKAYAREQGLLIKQFSGKGAQQLMFHWEHVSQLPTIEARLSQLCQWILTAEKSGFSYGLQMPRVDVNIASGIDHQHHCLEQLSLYGIQDETN